MPCDNCEAAEKALASWEKGMGLDQWNARMDKLEAKYKEKSDALLAAERQLSEATAALSGRTVLSEEAKWIAEASQSLDFDNRHPKGLTEAAYSHVHRLLLIVRRLTNGDEK